MISPGDFLLKNFIIPSGKSIGAYANLLNTFRANVSRIVKGDQEMSLLTVYKLSKATCTSPKLWIYIQTEWLFSRFLQRRKVKTTIPSLKPNPTVGGYDFNSPGQILHLNFIKPLGVTIFRFAAMAKIDGKTLMDIVNDKQRMSLIVVVKLGIVLGTGAKYWLEMQSRYQVKQILKSHFIDKKFIDSLTAYCNSGQAGGKASSKRLTSTRELHPGIIMNENYLKPTGISIVDWTRFFCMTKKIFRSIINGRTEIPVGMILKLSNLTSTRPVFWIELQNNHYAAKAKTLSAQLRITERINEWSFVQGRYTLPVDSLVNNFLRPMNITFTEFANHIKVSQRRIYSLTYGLVRMDFELAIRIGEALDIDPKYWVYLQMEEDIIKYESAHET